MTVKRSRDDDSYRKVEIFAMTNCLMLLPSVGKSQTSSGSDHRVFPCKTCNRKFSSFQALGGHRASHKKLKLMTSDLSSSLCLGVKPKKIHECPICGLVFPLGQALGGHMRRHRPHHPHNHRSSSSSSSSGGGGGGGVVLTDQAAAPVLLDDDESNRDRVVFFLDLNLSPYENDLKSVP